MHDARTEFRRRAPAALGRCDAARSLCSEHYRHGGGQSGLPALEVALKAYEEYVAHNPVSMPHRERYPRLMRRVDSVSNLGETS